jgi:hypothetical protein
MKYIITAIFFSAFIGTTSAQFRSVGFTAGAGYTVINVQKVNDPILLSDWDNFSLVFKGYAEYQLSKGNLIGLEVGRNRLYYWEYPAPGYTWYNWRTEWTTNAVFYISKYFGERFFVQAGPGIHIFYNGTVFGLMGSAGTSFPIGKSLSIPVTFRIEPVFGSGTPIAVNLATGIRFNLMK